MGLFNPAKILEYHENVPECAPGVLFEFGQDATLVPNMAVPNIGGFAFSVVGGKFVSDAECHVQLQVARLNLDIGLEGSIVEHSLEGGTRIEINNRLIGDAAMMLAMSELEGGGTKIDYGICLRPSRFALPGSSTAFEGLIQRHIKRFAAKYKKNILREIPDSQKLLRADNPTT